MTSTRSKWTVMTCVVVLTLTAILASMAMDPYIFHLPRKVNAPIPPIPKSRYPHLPTPDEVVEVFAEIYPSSSLPMTPKGPFPVPKKFHRDVCAYFAEPIGEDYHVRQLYLNVGRRPPKSLLERWRAGKLHFKLRGGRDLDMTFYWSSERSISFSIESDFFSARTSDQTGGLTLYLLLDQARQAAEIPLPPADPPKPRKINGVIASGRSGSD